MYLDIFMRELSYEEIEQQVAYDMTNLWSKAYVVSNICRNAFMLCQNWRYIRR